MLSVLVPLLSYQDIKISSGDEASIIYQEFINGNISLQEWYNIKQHLLEYCKLDTLAMVEILKVINTVVSKQ